MNSSQLPIRKAEIQSFAIPTATQEADGTLSWDKTTLIIAHLQAGTKSGLGYTYGHHGIRAMGETLASSCLIGREPFDIPSLHAQMRRKIRNNGNCGMTAMAVSMLDIALWDLKARLLGCSVSRLLGKAIDGTPAYGSGGFCSYSDPQLSKQLGGWASKGFHSVKMKVGADPERDPERVKAARKAIGGKVHLFVDANGAYSSTQALKLAEVFQEQGVSWFEEPVSSDRLELLRLVKDRAPAGMDVAAGEYGYESTYFRRMLEAAAVDVLQADATRCFGFTGFLQAAAIAHSFGIPLSAHCAPSLHMHIACAVPGTRNIEYFFDHARIEEKLFDGFIAPVDGCLKPDSSREGLGIVFKEKDALQFAA